MFNQLPKLAAIGMLLYVVPASAQFRGGSGQGFTTSNATSAQLGVSIFKGGADDGISLFTSPNANLGVNIYKGGADDGVTVYNQAAANLGINIYKGGTDDGFTVFNQSSANLGINIYKGGTDDGFTVFNQATTTLGTNIYKGGGNDGWAVSLNGLLLPLPVTLTRFNGAWLLDDAVLNWETATEINSDHFEIERSFNGRDFTAAGSVNAAGESNDIRKYSYKDPRIRLSLPSGIVYYRLKTVDRDGSFAYSAVVILQSTNTQVAYSLYPNPARDKITMQILGNGGSGSAMLYLYDVNGKLLTRTSMLGNRQELDIRNLSAGTYVIVLMIGGNAVYNQKIIVQK